MKLPATLYSLPALALLLCVPLASAQNWHWVRGAGTGAGSRGIDLDASGNIYVTGGFRGTATVGDTTLTSPGTEADIYLTKLSPNGGARWTLSGGSTGQESAAGVALDAEGNAFVAGSFEGTATFGPFTLESAGETDIFLIKVSPDGEVLWARSAGGDLGDGLGGVASGAEGNVFITGSFHSSSIIFGDTTLTNHGFFDQDIFMVKYSPDGEVSWAHSVGDEDSDSGAKVTVDTEGYAYFTGQFRSSITFGHITLLGTAGFLAKYSPEGEVQWAERVGFNVVDLALDPNSNAYVTGDYIGTTAFGSFILTGSATYLAKYSPGGVALWARSSDIRYAGITADAHESLYTTGFFSGTVAFGDTTLTSTVGRDIFLAKLDPEGEVLWAQSAGGSITGTEGGQDVEVDADGSAYIIGTLLGIGAFGNCHHEFGIVFVAKSAAPAAIAVTAAPVDPPVIIPPDGGSAQFMVTLTNPRTQPQTVMVWTAITGPGGREQSLLGPLIVTLPAGATVTRTLMQEVPASAPAGEYTYHVRTGFLCSIADSASFTFLKEASVTLTAGETLPAGAAPESSGWTTRGWTDGVGTVAPNATRSFTDGYTLSPVHPNPFASETQITLEVAETQHVTAEVLDGLGRRVALLHNGSMAAGATRALVLRAGTLPSGLYVVRVTGERFTTTRRVALVR